jgi:hypothetical protein
MNRLCRRFISMQILFLCVCLGFVPFFRVAADAEAKENKVLSKIMEADELISRSFDAVLEAERAGADVSNLMMQLSSAAHFLAEAHAQNRTGNFARALQNAMLSVQSVEGVIEDAERLKMSADAEYKERAFNAVAASMVIISVIALLSITSWQLLKRRHLDEILNLKPEAVCHES